MPFRSAGGCPHCAGSFLRFQTDSYSYMRCSRCVGIWIEWEVLAKLLRDIAPERNWELPSGGEHKERKRRCPKCSSTMLRSHIFQIPVDYCKNDRHGIWLDKDELKKILEKVADDDLAPPTPPTSFTSLLNDFFSQ